MKKDNSTPNIIDEYISRYPDNIQAMLEAIRAAIRKEAPDAAEKISYGIPTFYMHGNLVHFAAYKNHIGFYPGASGIDVFKDDLSNYSTSKGTVQFPVDEPLPLILISKIVQYRVKQNKKTAAIKVGATKKMKSK